MNKKAEQILKAVNHSRVRKRLNRELNGVHHTATVDARLQPFLVPWWVTGTPHTLAYSDGLERELWIHWYYVPRNEPRMEPYEIFHLNMLWSIGVPKAFSKVHIRIAMDGGLWIPDYLAETLDNIFGDGLDVRAVRNDSNRWELDTFCEMLEYAQHTKPSTALYYTHFKGASRVHSDNAIGFTRANDTADSVLMWCFLLYRLLFRDTDALTRGVGIGALRQPSKVLGGKSTSHNAGSFQAFTCGMTQHAATPTTIRDTGNPWAVESYLGDNFKVEYGGDTNGMMYNVQNRKEAQVISEQMQKYCERFI